MQKERRHRANHAHTARSQVTHQGLPDEKGAAVIVALAARSQRGRASHADTRRSQADTLTRTAAMTTAKHDQPSAIQRSSASLIAPISSAVRSRAVTIPLSHSSAT